MARHLVLIGPGTSVGKTYVAERLLRALAKQGHHSVGYKPVESGFAPGEGSDIARLAGASTFHVKPPLASQTLSAPVSPHLAARLEGRTLDLDEIREEIRRACASAARVVLVELPGGAFSPLTEAACCADFARSLAGVRTLLVAADHLGVLHEIGSTTRACAAIGLPVDGVILSAPEVADSATGHNAVELRHVTSSSLVAALPRVPVASPLLDADPVCAAASWALGP